MILHIAIDEKFIDMAYNMFERVSPGNNEFMVVGQAEFRYIKTAPVSKISLEEFLDDEFLSKLDGYEFIVFHWLDDYKLQLLKKIPKDIKVLWIGWGGDYYHLIKRNLLLPKTQLLKLSFDFKSALKNGPKSAIKFLVQSWFDKIFGENKNYLAVINRINFFAPVLKEDYDLIKKHCPDFKPEFIDWNYGTLEDDLIRDIDCRISGSNIFVGNSATYQNNHLEAFDMLKKNNIDKKWIITSLSYGGGGADERYKNQIISYGYKLFGDKFFPLTDFLGIDEYNKILSSCSVVVMNHIRQQALGNIVTAMYLGSKIFLRKENPVFSFFKNNGARVFSVDELNEEAIENCLSKEEIMHNRNFLKNYWSRDVLVEKTSKLIIKIKGR